jgi:serine/threonine protein kinase
VNGKAYPVLVMEWVDGEPIKDFVKRRLGTPSSLSELALAWRGMLSAMTRDRIAHGDLQDENVLVKETGRGLELKLIDYDTVVVPNIQGLPENNAGLPAYQHPRRPQVKTKNLHIDSFSGLVVYAALSAIAEKPSLWSQFDIEARDKALLFAADDFRAPATSSALRELDSLGGEPARLSAALRDACLSRQPLDVPTLESVLGSSPSAPVSSRVYTPRPNPSVGGHPSVPTIPSAVAPWWQNTTPLPPESLAQSVDEVPPSPPSTSPISTVPPRLVRARVAATRLATAAAVFLILGAAMLAQCSGH